MDRLFLAVWPDRESRARLAALPHPHRRGVRWTAPEQWHVTLRFLGEVAADTVTDRLDATPLPSATARLGPALTMLGPNLIVPVGGLDELADAIIVATDGLGDPPRRRFRGHLTLARTGRRAPADVVGHPIDASFAVDEVTLVRSELRPEGARYTTVARFPTSA